jgi:hypothetical protein
MERRYFGPQRGITAGLLLFLAISSAGCSDRPVGDGGGGTSGQATGGGGSAPAGTSGAAGTGGREAPVGGANGSPQGGSSGTAGTLGGTAAPSALEAGCSAVCAKMDGLFFPQSLCEDAQAFDYGAYFCKEEGDGGPPTCTLACISALQTSPTEACRTAWAPLMACIANSSGYLSLVLQPSRPFGACLPNVNNTGLACWGHAVLP